MDPEPEFELFSHPQWTNLSIYPEMGQLELVIGFLNELNTAFNLEGWSTDYIIESPYELFIRKHLKFNACAFKFESILVIYSDKTPGYISSDVLITNQANVFNFFKCIKITNGVYMYCREHIYKIFIKHFWYYFDGLEFNYDNLICLTMIVKDAGPEFENVLKANLPFFDRWCILDTGSTDETQQTIKRVLQNKKGELYTEPFVDFKVSRNRCLELAGKVCKFIIMLDDTYILKGDIRRFLNEIRGDTFSDSFSLMIQSNDNEYYSNRIIKSESSLRYIHTIHEVITDQNNINVTIPTTEAHIFDARSDYMEQRTMNRKQLDLELLFKELQETPNDPRTIYYIGQTYGCINDEINKAMYFEKRIQLEGYIQERIDALFELARCYNFRINCETKQYLNSPLTSSQWQRCEELYLQAYSLDKSRPDSLYFIGIHYYLLENYQTAYTYFKQGFEVGYPIASQYSLKPTLSYYFLPKFLTEVCYYVEDYQLGLNSAQIFLQKNQQNCESWNLVSNWYKIHQNLVKIPQKRKVVVIVTDGGWEPWTGRDIETKGLGGSETWIVETAKALQIDFNVIVFCRTNSQEFYEGVRYTSVELFHEFISITPVEHCVVSRFTEYIPVALKGLTKSVSIIFHDIILPETIIPIDPKIKCIIGLTKWHQEGIKSMFPQFKTAYLNYGINSVDFVKNESIKLKNSFIYSSFPNRGLVVLLDMWPRIKKILPDATLNVYCNLEQEWVNSVAPEMMKKIKETVNQQGIKLHGWVSKSQLKQAWEISEYWLYPCIFDETFCLTALEAAVSKTFVITNGLAALSETAKYGITIEGNPLSDEWQLRCLNKLKDVSKQCNLKNKLINFNYEWACSASWKKQTDKLINLIN